MNLNYPKKQQCWPNVKNVCVAKMYSVVYMLTS